MAFWCPSSKLFKKKPWTPKIFRKYYSITWPWKHMNQKQQNIFVVIIDASLFIICIEYLYFKVAYFLSLLYYHLKIEVFLLHTALCWDIWHDTLHEYIVFWSIMYVKILISPREDMAWHFKIDWNIYWRSSLIFVRRYFHEIHMSSIFIPL